MLSALEAEQIAVRLAAARALWKIDPKNQRSVPVLIDALKDSDSQIRRQATEALTTIGAAAKKAVPALIRELKGKYNRLQAARALGAIGPEAKAAIPVLKHALRDQNRSVRLAARDALEKIDSGALVATDSSVSISPWVWVAFGLLIGYGLWTLVKGRKHLAEGMSTSFVSRPEQAESKPRGKIDYYRPGYVSLWVGRFPSAEASEAYFKEESAVDPWKPAPFSIELGLGFYPPDCLEVNFEQVSPRPLSALLQDVAFSGSFFQSAVEAANRQDIHEGQGIALLYDFDYQAKPGWTTVVGPMRFVGTFPFDGAALPAKYHVVAEKAGCSISAVLFILAASLDFFRGRREQGKGHASAREFCDFLLTSDGDDTAAILRGLSPPIAAELSSRESTAMILRELGLVRSEDIGRVVFGLVDIGLISRQESDSEADFQGLFALE